MKMTKVISHVALLLMAGCGGEPRWASLPEAIHLNNARLTESAKSAVSDLNAKLGTVLVIADSASTEVYCDEAHTYLLNTEAGHADIHWDMDSIITHSEIYINCSNSDDDLKKIIAHELFHSLGFDYHYADKKCLNQTHPIDLPSVTAGMCPEMLADFHGRY